MSSKSEISALIHRAMQEKQADEAGMAKLLGVSPIMMGKIMSGEIVPSRHLEKQMIELLGVQPEKALTYRRIG